MCVCAHWIKAKMYSHKANVHTQTHTTMPCTTFRACNITFPVGDVIKYRTISLLSLSLRSLQPWETLSYVCQFSYVKGSWGRLCSTTEAGCSKEPCWHAAKIKLHFLFALKSWVEKVQSIYLEQEKQIWDSLTTKTKKENTFKCMNRSQSSKSYKSVII